MRSKAEKIHSIAALAVLLAYVYYLGHQIFSSDQVIHDLKMVAPFLLTGVAALAFLLIARILLRPRSRSGTRMCVPDLVGRLAHVALFLAVVAILKQVDLAGNDFDRIGPAMAGRHLCRLLLAIYLTAACFGAGKMILERGFRQKEFPGGGERFILYFFSGAAALSLAGVGAGLFGWLNTAFALLSTVPFIFYAAPAIRKPLEALYQRGFGLYQKDPVDFSGYFVISWILFGVCLFFVAVRILFCPAADSDVWAHYLPYYREVIRTGSLGPNELWYHFYLSKGAGMFFLSGLLSDPFGPQLVSLCFIAASCVILFQFCRRFTRSSPAALAALAVFLCLYDGSPLKHHAVLTGLVIFLVWIVARVFSSKEPLKAETIAGTLTAFYFGVYQPAAFSLMLFSWILLAAWFYLFKEDNKKIFYLAAIGFSGGAGILSVFLVNFFATGLCFDVPHRFFWSFADTDKFVRTMGLSGISFFMQTNSDINPESVFFNFGWAKLFFRVESILPLFPVPFLIAGSLSVLSAGKQLRAAREPLTVCLLFALCAFLFGQAIHVGSIIRLYAFILFFMVLFCFIFLGSLLNALPVFLRKGLTFLCLFFLMSAVFFRSIDKIGPIRATVLDHLLGRVSFGDAVRKVEAVFENSITTSVTGRFSKLVKPGERLFSLGHDPGPAYSFPGTGIVSEPSYTLGPHAEEIMFGPPQEAKKWLKERNLNYFMLGFEEPFLVGLPFSRLFNSENIALYFRVVAKEGDVYLLGWREENRKGEEVPTLLIQMNELRRTAASSYAFSEQWGRDLGPAVRPFIREGRLFLTDETGNALDDKIIQVLSNKMIGPVQLTENKALLGEAVLSVAANLRSNRRQLADAVNQRMRQGPPAGQEISALEGISWYVRSTLRDVYFKRYGPSLAKLLIGMNSPTKDIYESREVFRERLNLRR